MEKKLASLPVLLLVKALTGIFSSLRGRQVVGCEHTNCGDSVRLTTNK